ncbi:MAG: MBL fold metallo-hydrolase [Methanosarcinales archaeon]|uniref:MBL fold metallo-hydrolase n=1 Tax=Candidatus Ethanoperedens thermophilum TaxID=2766897 RepID=A0A848D8W3_9EURY|nr:MBL fold metallo-hydrolase [Candidatus Ethanoperedens thermophilum]
MVRSKRLSCFVRTGKQRILIDPGISLGYNRYGLLPHPFQVAVDERIQKKIVQRWSEATDIVISHFHGDHIPLKDANPYQFSIKKITGLNPDVRIWAKNPSHLHPIEEKRVESLSAILKNDFVAAEGIKHGAMTFSGPVFHGGKRNNPQTVMMTRIKEDRVFVHTSDIQLLDEEAISQILDWEPDIVLADGPPLYMPDKLPEEQIERAWHNARRLSREVDTLILDHHLMRSYAGIEWLERLSSETRNKVICGADFMKQPRMLLEAGRKSLYRDMPVPAGWHEAYAEGNVGTDRYWNLAKRIYKSMRLDDYR